MGTWADKIFRIREPKHCILLLRGIHEPKDLSLHIGDEAVEGELCNPQRHLLCRVVVLGRDDLLDGCKSKWEVKNKKWSCFMSIVINWWLALCGPCHEFPSDDLNPVTFAKPVSIPNKLTPTRKLHAPGSNGFLQVPCASKVNERGSRIVM